MFDLITGQTKHIPRHQGAPILLSMTVQALIVAAVVAIPYLYVTEQLPEMPSMMAFVAAPPAPPPPPPPPAPAPSRPAAKPIARPTTVAQLQAPIEAPQEIAPEPVATGGEEWGVPGGVEGGVPGGVVGGMVGGIPDLVPPPPPPAPAAPRGPVRIGGQLKAPELVRRVDPVYPPLGMMANMEGLVILEATVDEEGNVSEVRVLRSAGYAGVLDRAAVAALKQWRYSPLLLNGRPTSFVLTVTLSFSLEDT